MSSRWRLALSAAAVLAGLGTVIAGPAQASTGSGAGLISSLPAPSSESSTRSSCAAASTTTALRLAHFSAEGLQAPADIRLRAADTGLVLTFTDTNAGQARYRLRYMAASGGPAHTVQLSAGRCAHQVDGLMPGISYVFALTAETDQESTTVLASARTAQH